MSSEYDEHITQDGKMRGTTRGKAHPNSQAWSAAMFAKLTHMQSAGFGARGHSSWGSIIQLLVGVTKAILIYGAYLYVMNGTETK